MGFSKVVAALALTCLASFGAVSQAADDVPLPWDGRGQDLTVATLGNKYLLHILNQRQSGTGNPADYVTVQQKGRSPAFNGDTGVINIAVDDKAIFGGQTTFRRSELVQQFKGDATTYFRASIMANAALVNKYVWQVIFPESHQWEIFVDATASPMQLQFRTDSNVRWKADFDLKTWFNFGVAVSSSGIVLYQSSGSGALTQVWKSTSGVTAPSNWEFHIGLLTLSNDGSQPKMAATQDILSFNGVSVEKSVSTTGGSGGGSSGSASTPSSPAATTSTPSSPAATPAPATTKTKAPSSPTVTTATPTTSAPQPAATSKSPAAGSKCKSRRRN